MPGELAAVSLGSNLGPSQALLARAVETLAALESCQLEAVSSLYKTRPWGDVEQPDFLNAVVLLRWQGAAHGLLQQLQSIERQLGRVRDKKRRWGPRAIDLDILCFGDLQLADSDLTLPHPRMAQRRFVLVPLAELAPDLHIPGYGSVASLLAQCPDQDEPLPVGRPEPWYEQG